jgi:hypothetical protein
MYYNGFALQNEAHFFDSIINESRYALSGFSYGAVKAFQEVQSSPKRIDTLQLISPAFFQSRDEKFKRLQLMGYRKSAAGYVNRFTENCFAPYKAQKIEIAEHSYAGLEELLHYEWQEDALKAVTDRGVRIEVYLGSDDRITDVEAAYAFFVPFATVYLIKGANHFLQGEEYE